MSCTVNPAQSCADCMDSNGGAWYLLLYMFLETDMLDYIYRVKQELEERRAFEKYAEDCPYLELDNDGRATHHICRHPVRDNLSDWVMCDRGPCPFMAVNASSEETGEYERKLLREACQHCRPQGAGDRDRTV